MNIIVEVTEGELEDMEVTAYQLEEGLYRSIDPIELEDGDTIYLSNFNVNVRVLEKA